MKEREADIMKKGTKWIIRSRGTVDATIELMEDVDPKEDTFFKAKLVAGRREFLRRENAYPGDIEDFRTTLTTFIKEVK